MSISQPLNNRNAKTQYVECLKLVIYKNLHALKTYWPLILLSQLPLVYNLSIKNATEHPIKSSKVEAKNPVSYTHLDVYKRQPTFFVLFGLLFIIPTLILSKFNLTTFGICWIGLWMLIIIIGLWTVSYTHLDVYKRQVQVIQKRFILPIFN